MAARPSTSPAREPVISNKGMRHKAHAADSKAMNIARGGLARPRRVERRTTAEALASIGNIVAKNKAW